MLKTQPQAVTTAPVPFVLTKALRQQLYDLGHSRTDVDAMPPEDAWRILGISPDAPQPEPSFILSLFDNVKDISAKPEILTLAQIADRIKLPLIRPNKDGQLWTGATFKRSKRAKPNVETVSVLMLDVDDKLSFDEAEQLCRALGCAFLLHTTFSHSGMGQDKFRIIFPLSSPITVADYPALWQWANQHFQGKLDGGTKDAGRMFYVPAIERSDAPYRYVIETNAPLLGWKALLPTSPSQSPTQTVPDDVVVSAPQGAAHEQYARKAFDEELDRVRKARSGARNDTLNKAVFACAQFIPHNLLTEAEIRSAFTQASAGIGLTSSEIDATLRSAIEKGMASPHDLSGVGTKPDDQPEDALVWINGYAAGSDGLKLKKTGSGNAVFPVALCNFTAAIIGDVVQDDGSEQRRCYELKARLEGETKEVRGIIPSADFSSLKWLDEVLGARAVIYPGKSEHVKCAIKLLSNGAESRRVIAHTGWRNDDGTWLYYHKGGAIGADGLIAAEVELPAALAPFLLPSPPQSSGRQDVITAVHELLALTDDAIMIPAVGGVFVALLGNADFALHLAGTTGRGKSQVAALVQAFFGSGFDDKHFPASWESTGNSLEIIAHTAKDAICVIDDFCPRGNPSEVSKLHALADRVLRGQGNHTGRARLRSDSSLRAARPPRGLLLSTGEDVPKGQSLRGRLLILEIAKSVINNVLTDFQNAAAAGIYAQATAAFVQWLATDSRIGVLQARQNAQKAYWRSYWSGRLKAEHNRIPTTLALLSEAWTQWLTFAEECHAITPGEKDDYWKRIETALTAAAENQSFYQTSDDPALRFVELLQAAFASGKAYLDDYKGGAPQNAESWGWRNGTPTGERVGWLAHAEIYLIPDAAYALAHKSGDFAISQQTLWKRLKERGFLVTEGARQTNKVRRFIEGTEQPVIALKISCFDG